jgi:hypothetical protein
VLLLDAPITLREVMAHEEVPLADVFREVGHFLVGREDVVLFGAQAVNVYAETERMTQDVDLLSTRAEMVVDELRIRLADRFRIAAPVRAVAPGTSYRLYQLRRPKNRHLVDVRQVDTLPAFRVVEGLRVAAPEELVAMKVIAIAARRGRPKELSDRLDVKRMLLALPELRQVEGVVAERLRGGGASEATLGIWREIVDEPSVDDEDDAW